VNLLSCFEQAVPFQWRMFSFCVHVVLLHVLLCHAHLHVVAHVFVPCTPACVCTCFSVMSTPVCVHVVLSCTYLLCPMYTPTCVCTCFRAMYTCCVHVVLSCTCLCAFYMCLHMFLCHVYTCLCPCGPVMHMFLCPFGPLQPLSEMCGRQ